MIEKFSFGVACCRRTGGAKNYEMLMIQKRNTYQFVNFVLGFYNPSNKEELMKMFNGMTMDEKINILSFNFQHLWYLVWLNSNICMRNFMPAKHKFETSFLAGGGIFLRRLVESSLECGKRMWEIPKGRQIDKNEAPISSAIREFEEETGLTKEQYKIFPDKYQTFSHIDCGVRYTNVYFIAIVNPTTPVAPPLRVTFNQVSEVINISWMSLRMITQEAPDISPTARRIFNFVKKHND